MVEFRTVKSPRMKHRLRRERKGKLGSFGGASYASL
jgi:hypothetical protein